MTAAELDRIIEWLRAADRASARGAPDLARLYATLARAAMKRAGMRYADGRRALAIDQAIDQALATGGRDD